MDKHDRFDPPRPTRLIGQFYCLLTREEMNQWHEFISATPERIAQEKATHELAILIARQNGTTDDLSQSLRGLMMEQCSLDDQLHRIARSWYANLTETKPEDVE